MAIDPKKDGAPPREIHVEEKKSSWLPWLIGALLLAALVFGLTQCDTKREQAEVAPAVVPAESVDSAPAVVDPMVDTNAEGVGVLTAYLSGDDPAPRSFMFSGSEFASGESEILPQNRGEIDAVAAALKQHPTARVRLVGYADARGGSAMNAKLGKERADSLKAALVADGVAAARIKTASGGETDPAATNATAGGRTVNRRTELVVLSR